MATARCASAAVGHAHRRAPRAPRAALLTLAGAALLLCLLAPACQALESHNYEGDDDGGDDIPSPKLSLKNKSDQGKEEAPKGQRFKFGAGDRFKQGAAAGRGGGEGDRGFQQAAQEDVDAGPLDFSVAGVARIGRIVGFARDPIKALFGVGLLLYGKEFAHLVLFMQAFKVTGYPLVSDGIAGIQSDYKHFTSGVDKRSINPIQALKASVDPSSIRSILAGIYAGILACLAAVVSPLAGATGVGLSIGNTVEPHIRPVVRQQLVRFESGMAGGRNAWLDYAAGSSAQVVSVVFALISIKFINTLSGALMGAQMVTEVLAKYFGMFLRTLARRFDKPWLQQAASGFSTKHMAVGAISWAMAGGAFAWQARNSASMSLTMKIVLGIPLVFEKALTSLKWALLAKGARH